MTNTLPDPVGPVDPDPSLRESASPAPAPRPLRWWPAAMFVALFLVAYVVLPLVIEDVGAFPMLGGAIATLGVVIWWLFFSRARWVERLAVVGVMAVAMFATVQLVHPSIRNGMMGIMPFIFTLQAMTFALAAGVAISHRWPTTRRRAAMAAAIVLGCAGMMLIRTEGIRGGGDAQLRWRWTPTPEDELLAQANDEPQPTSAASTPTPAAAADAAPAATGATPSPSGSPASTSAGTSSAPSASASAAPTSGAKAAASGSAPAAASAAAAGSASAPAAAAAEPRAAWPGFRGPDRDGVVHGVRIVTDWAKSPPVEVWRRKIGPAWSSFAVRGDMLYTQEQRGDDEIVASYRLTSGAPVWRHRDATRFWESNAGAGPRATPTLSGGRVYTLGGTGILNVLDANTGAVIWSRNAATDSGGKVPYWGLAGSPLVVDDLVVVAVSGHLIAYDRATGNRRWIGETKGVGYSSPHLVTIAGVPQIILLNGTGATGVSLADGKMLWSNEWAGFASLQPALIADGDMLFASGGSAGGAGTRRIAVTRGPSGWTASERWTSIGLKPYFNDIVVHEGHAYGFDGRILACIDLADGSRKWKGGRYGNGQLVLLPEQDLLLVLSEDGELALVSATPGAFTEIARAPALEGKTWNHPVLVGDMLLVRNDHEMAAFRLSLAPKADSNEPD